MEILPLSHPEPIGKLPPGTLQKVGEVLGPGFCALTVEDGQLHRPTLAGAQVLGALTPLTEMILERETTIRALHIEINSSYVAPGEKQRTGRWHKDHDVFKRKPTYTVADAFPTEFLVRPRVLRAALEQFRGLSSSSDVDSEALTTVTPNHGLRIVQPLPDVVTRFRGSWHRSGTNMSEKDTLRLWIRATVNP